MTHRVVSRLEWATPCADPWPERGRRRGAKAKGLAFQRKVTKALPWALAQRWFYFRDANGPGHCSPDLIFPMRGAVLVFEVKLTDWPEATTQITQLYKPVLEYAFQRPVAGCVIAKNLSHKTQRGRVVENLGQAYTLMSAGIVPIWHLPWPERLAHNSPDLMEGLGIALAPLRQFAKLPA